MIQGAREMENSVVAEKLTPALDQTPLPRALGCQLDRKAILARLQGDEELFRDLVALFMEDTPHLVKDAREALASGDASSLQRAAHTIKGSVSNFGAGPAVDAAWRLEQVGQSADLSEGLVALEGVEQALADVERELTRLVRN
jgi:HPt (histidine-containing phosphotransfer) domain-containing protein